MKKLNAAFVVAGLLMLPATAFAASDGSREKVFARVNAADLDLSKPEDLARLRARMQAEINNTCNPQDQLNSKGQRDYQCYREMSAKADSAVYGTRLSRN